MVYLAGNDNFLHWDIFYDITNLEVCASILQNFDNARS